ncbi:phospholipase-like protein, partial [Tanacetum coccineum]
MLGRQIDDENDDDENVPLNYSINNELSIQFGREEFCLITGLRFGVENWEEYDTQANLPFRRRVFPSHLDGQPITGIDIENAIVGPTFAELYDNDAVGLCCLGILQLVLLGAENKRNVPEWLLRIANDRVAWDKYPWGSYVWPTLYSQLRNATVRRWGPLYVDEPTNEDDRTTYSIYWIYLGIQGGIEQSQFKKLTDLLIPIVLNPCPDRWFWSLEGSGEFSVASIRRFIDDQRLLTVDSKTLWIKSVPIKVNILAWKIKLEALPTRFNISRR